MDHREIERASAGKVHVKLTEEERRFLIQWKKLSGEDQKLVRMLMDLLTAPRKKR